MTLDQLICKQACQDVLAQFAAALDSGDNNAAADLFSDDGYIITPQGKAVGPDVREVINKRPSDIVATHHALSNILVRPLDSERAEAECYLQVYRAQRADPTPRPLPDTPQAIGKWIIGFRKTTAGWRISAYDAVALFEPKAG